MLQKTELPVHPYFIEAIKKGRTTELYMPDYEYLAKEAVEWANTHNILPAMTQEFDFSVLAVDFQIAFCNHNGPLFVAGRSGDGAIRDTERLVLFIMKYLHLIKRIIPTMDTHRAMAVFHAMFWVDHNGNHPNPGTQITVQDVANGVWQVNPRIVAQMFGGNLAYAARFALHYVTTLDKKGKKLLIIWPYHVLMGGIDHALMPILHEAIFFWEVARATMRETHVKGGHPFFENYSVVNPEVSTLPDPHNTTGEVQVIQANTAFIRSLATADMIFIPNEAKSHCGADSITDIGTQFSNTDPEMMKKIYLPDDMASSVYIPGVLPGGGDLDFTDIGDQAYADFANAGMHVVTASEVPPWEWPGVAQTGWE